MRVFLILLALVAIGCRAEPLQTPPPFHQLVERVRSGESAELIVDNEPIGDAQLELLVNLPHLQHLAIEDFVGTADGLKSLPGLTELKRLQLRGGEVDDTAVHVIAGCSGLKNLNLPDASFSDTALAELQSLDSLELLRFHAPLVTDEGMKHIAKIENLRFLHLINVSISDVGLTYLESMRQLESLYLDDTSVTDDGVERLLTALPELHFHINQQHSDRDPSKGSHSH